MIGHARPKPATRRQAGGRPAGGETEKTGFIGDAVEPRSHEGTKDLIQTSPARGPWQSVTIGMPSPVVQRRSSRNPAAAYNRRAGVLPAPVDTVTQSPA